MKTNIIKTAAVLFCIVCYSHSCISAQNVGINATGATPDNSAILDVSSTTKGQLLPRMNTTERDAIASTARGLTIYNTDCGYDGSGWKTQIAMGDVMPGAAGTISGTATVCQGQTGVAYTISAVSGASGYVWTYTGTGFSIASGANTNAITADFSVTATAGNLTVYATHACESGDPSPVYSIAVDVLALAPVATAATGIAATSFDANWNTSAGATTYYIDVDDNSDFSSPLAGYNDLDVGVVLTYSITGLTCGTPYYYRVRAGNACGAGVNSNSITATPTAAIPDAPTANAATSVTGTSFDANWSASAGATTYYIDVDDNSDFSSPLAGYNDLDVGAVVTYGVTGLTCGGTNYYYQVRAANACGTSASSGSITVTTGACWTCGDPIVDARDGKTYNTVFIAGSASPYCLGSSQCWLAQNLDYGTYVTTATGQGGAGTQKYCYGNNTANCTTYGGLYEWTEMMNGAASVGGNGPGPQGICPTGWHLPTDNEWKCLEMNLGMSQANADATGWRAAEGGKLKQTGTTLWTSPNTGATNSSGFTALPGGHFSFGSSRDVGGLGTWWSATGSGGSAWSRYLYYNNDQGNRISPNKTDGQSVRCVKD